MTRKLDDLMAALPAQRRERVEKRAMELATLKDLRVEKAPRRRASGTRSGSNRAPARAA